MYDYQRGRGYHKHHERLVTSLNLKMVDLGAEMPHHTQKTMPHLVINARTLMESLAEFPDLAEGWHAPIIAVPQVTDFGKLLATMKSCKPY